MVSYAVDGVLVGLFVLFYGIGAGVYATAGNYRDIRAERAPES